MTNHSPIWENKYKPKTNYDCDKNCHVDDDLCEHCEEHKVYDTIEISHDNWIPDRTVSLCEGCFNRYHDGELSL